MIPRETVSQILDSVSILDVVGDYVSLKRRGANYLGLCPFHNEKTPSFTVSPAKGFFKCFGCGKSGDGVRFLMEQEHLSYPEVLRLLAKKAGIEIQEEERTEKDELEQREKESLFLIHAFAQKLFTSDLLETQEGVAIGLSYLQERGFSEATIEKFQLGYARNQRDFFSQSALKEGFSKDYLVKSGISIDGERGMFDRFAGRVIFPIHNLSGRVIGFGGRILTNDKKTAKYLNSPETDIYQKSRVLYGLNHSRKAIIQADNCYLVEGYTDVISLHQAGVENVVSSSGTSLTIDQIRVLRRFTKNITLLYDGDAAGIKASFRGTDLLLAEGMNVRVLLFPDGEDPDSFSRKTPQHELLSFLQDNVTDFIRFKANLLLADVQNDPIGKARLIRDMVESIAHIPDPIVRSLFIKDCGRIMDVEEAILIVEVNKQVRKNRDASFKGEGVKSAEGLSPQEPAVDTAQSPETLSPEILPEKSLTDNPVIRAESEIIRLMVRYGSMRLEIPLKRDLSDPAQANLPPTWPTSAGNYIRFLLEQIGYHFRDDVNREIFEECERWTDGDSFPGHEVFLRHSSDIIQKAAIDFVASDHSLSPNWTERFKLIIISEEDQMIRAIDLALSNLQLRVIVEKIDLLVGELSSISDADESMVILHQLKQLNEDKVSLSKLLNTVVVK